MHKLSCGLYRVALHVVPFTLIAVSAQAAAIFNIVGTSCDSQIVQPIALAATNNLVANPLPQGGGVQGAVLNGSCSDIVAPGGETLGPDGLVLEASMFGDFTGSDMPLPTTLPVEFDFTISIPDPGYIEILDWYVGLFINDTPYYSTGGSTSMNPANPNGAGVTATLPGGVLGAGDTWRAVAGVDCLFCEGLLIIDLGSSSLRINPVVPDQPAVPEPSTISLFAAGAALLWFKRRRQA